MMFPQRCLKQVITAVPLLRGVDFLNKVMPRYAVISCGKGNKYGHPHEETVTRLKKYASHLYVTADVGTIVFSSDGEGLSVSAEKGEK